MKISVITVCMNNLEGLKKTVNSVKMQSYPNVEHIIIDGDSKEGTKEYLESLTGERYVSISEPDEGISDAFNKGIRLASGEKLLFLNAGDYFLDKKILEEVAEDIQQEDADILYYIVKFGERTIPDCTDIEKADEVWKAAIIPHQASFIKKELFDQVGLYNKDIRIRMDYDFFKRCVINEVTYRYIPRVIVNYAEGGLSSTNPEVFLCEGKGIDFLYNKAISAKDLDECVDICQCYNAEKINNIYASRKNEVDCYREKHRKVSKMFRVIEKWMQIEMKHNNLLRYLEKNKYKNIAIYGSGRIGTLIDNYLQGTGIKVKYLIDINKCDGERIKGFDHEWELVDCIIVTLVDSIDEIKNSITKKVKTNILGFEEILDEIANG